MGKVTQIDETVKFVKSHLKDMLLNDKIKLFKEALNYQIDYKDCVYYHMGKECNQQKMIEIVQSKELWMGLRDFNVLKTYFFNLSGK